MSRLSLPVFLVLVALLLRSVIPMGYMPDISSGKVFHVTICTINGPENIALDKDMQPVEKQSGQHDIKEKCAFALLTHSPMHEFVTASLMTPYQVVKTQKLIFKDQAVRQSVLHRLAQPRAPPVVV